MKYAVEIGQGAMIQMSRSVKISSGVQKIIKGIYRQQGDLISLLLSLEKKETRLKVLQYLWSGDKEIMMKEFILCCIRGKWGGSFRSGFTCLRLAVSRSGQCDATICPPV
jgi:hypothetical protein